MKMYRNNKNWEEIKWNECWLIWLPHEINWIEMKFFLLKLCVNDHIALNDHLLIKIYSNLKSTINTTYYFNPLKSNVTSSIQM